ncbi:MAG: GNAT family N-acetyltransferase [Ruminococcaceae bacterium]|nr:GNAT family N-acetyltransferase [Oscillospiraceae bacterium]
MAQLIMNWKNDGTPVTEIALPEGVEVVAFPNLENALSAWADIIPYLNPDGNMDKPEDYYQHSMVEYPNYNDNFCFFVLVDNRPAATLTVICDYKKNKGYIHNVACKPDFRGKGLGTLLNSVAVNVLKKEGMEGAYLTTDDWRIPAIKSYLRAGFAPDTVSEPDFKERWEKIYSIIGK